MAQRRFTYIYLATLAVVRLEPMTVLIIYDFNFHEMKLKSDKVQSEFEPALSDLNAKMLTTTPAELLLERGTSFRQEQP